MKSSLYVKWVYKIIPEVRPLIIKKVFLDIIGSFVDLFQILIIVTHRVTVAKQADVLLVMKGGRLYEYSK